MVAIGGFIFYASVLTVPPETVVDAVKPGPPELIQLDKWRHFVAYGAFGGALAYATSDWEVRKRYVAVLVVGVTVLYGVGIEFWQSFLPERYFSVDDAYANALGGVLVTPWYLVRSRVEFVAVGDLLPTSG